MMRHGLLYTETRVTGTQGYNGAPRGRPGASVCEEPVAPFLLGASGLGPCGSGEVEAGAGGRGAAGLGG